MFVISLSRRPSISAYSQALQTVLRRWLGGQIVSNKLSAGQDLLYPSLIETDASHLIYNRESANHQADNERETEHDELHRKTSRSDMPHKLSADSHSLSLKDSQPCVQSLAG